MHGQAIYVCDWTGYPMKNSNCYMPYWQSDKLLKKGNYCNWESVLAHAEHNRFEGKIDLEEHCKITQHIKEIIGQLPDVSACHFSFLEHFKDEDQHWKKEFTKAQNWTFEEFHKQCCYETGDVEAVRIKAEGEVQSIIVDSNNGSFDFAAQLTQPYDSYDWPPKEFINSKHWKIATVQAVRRPKQLKDLTLLIKYWSEANGLPYNSTASNLFKIKIYGDAILVYQTKELSCKPRDRFVDFTKKEYDEIYNRKRKRGCCESLVMSVDEYKATKQDMQSSLHDFEAQASSLVERPQDLAKAAVMPLVSGKELKEVALLKEAEKMLVA